MTGLDWHELLAGVCFTICLVAIYAACYVVGPALVTP